MEKKYKYLFVLNAGMRLDSEAVIMSKDPVPGKVFHGHGLSNSEVGPIIFLMGERPMEITILTTRIPYIGGVIHSTMRDDRYRDGQIAVISEPISMHDDIIVPALMGDHGNKIPFTHYYGGSRVVHGTLCSITLHNYMNILPSMVEVYQKDEVFAAMKRAKTTAALGCAH